MENTVQKVVVFTGAGISVPLGLPDSVGFMDSVRQGWKPITQNVVEYLESVGPYGKDIEWILSTLESFKNGTSFTEFLLLELANRQGIDKALQTPQQQEIRRILRSMKDQLEKSREQASSEVTRIKKIILEKLHLPQPINALALYSNLISEIKNTFGKVSVSIITTNYDLAFETAFRLSRGKWQSEIDITDVDFCFSLQPDLRVYNPVQDFDWDPSIIEYLKIHGSVDWHKDAMGRCIQIMARMVPDNPDDGLVLYPGFKCVPAMEPFISMHGRFSQRLAEADQIIVIGYAFRDTYINNIFENIMRVRPDTCIIYFNPRSVDAFPDDSSAPDFIKNYHSFRHIRRGIGKEKNSLGLARLYRKLLESGKTGSSIS